VAVQATNNLRLVLISTVSYCNDRIVRVIQSKDINIEGYSHEGRSAGSATDSLSTQMLGEPIKLIISTFLTCTAIAAIGNAQLLTKLTFEGAVGPSIPVGSAQNSMNTGYNFFFGAGWKFTPNVSTLLEFQYAHSSLTNQTLQAFGEADGFNRFWSLTVNPRYYIHPKRKDQRLWHGWIWHLCTIFGLYRSITGADILRPLLRLLRIFRRSGRC
jgi:hypothetical protein